MVPNESVRVISTIVDPNWIFSEDKKFVTYETSINKSVWVFSTLFGIIMDPNVISEIDNWISWISFLSITIWVSPYSQSEHLISISADVGIIFGVIEAIALLDWDTILGMILLMEGLTDIIIWDAIGSWDKDGLGIGDVIILKLEDDDILIEIVLDNEIDIEIVEDNVVLIDLLGWVEILLLNDTDSELLSEIETVPLELPVLVGDVEIEAVLLSDGDIELLEELLIVLVSVELDVADLVDVALLVILRVSLGFGVGVREKVIEDVGVYVELSDLLIEEVGDCDFEFVLDLDGDGLNVPVIDTVIVCVDDKEMDDVFDGDAELVTDFVDVWVTDNEIDSVALNDMEAVFVSLILGEIDILSVVEIVSLDVLDAEIEFVFDAVGELLNTVDTEFDEERDIEFDWDIDDVAVMEIDDVFDFVLVLLGVRVFVGDTDVVIDEVAVELDDIEDVVDSDTDTVIVALGVCEDVGESDGIDVMIVELDDEDTVIVALGVCVTVGETELDLLRVGDADGSFGSAPIAIFNTLAHGDDLKYVFLNPVPLIINRISFMVFYNSIYTHLSLNLVAKNVISPFPKCFDQTPQ